MTGFFKKLFNRITGRKDEPAPPPAPEVEALPAPEPEAPALPEPEPAPPEPEPAPPEPEPAPPEPEPAPPELEPAPPEPAPPEPEPAPPEPEPAPEPEPLAAGPETVDDPPVTAKPVPPHPEPEAKAPVELKKPAARKPEPKKPEPKPEPASPATKKAEARKLEPKKPESKPEPAPPATKKAEARKPEPKKPEPKPEPAPPAAKKAEARKPEPKKPEPKPEPAPPAAKKAEAKKPEPKKPEPKPEVRRPAPKEPEPKRADWKAQAVEKTIAPSAKKSSPLPEPVDIEPPAQYPPPLPEAEIVAEPSAPEVEIIAATSAPVSEPEAVAPPHIIEPATAPAQADAGAQLAPFVPEPPAVEPKPPARPRDRLPPAAPAPEESRPRGGWFSRLKEGLAKSSRSLTGSITAIFTKRKLDSATLEELEDVLIQADLGVEMTTRIVKAVSAGRYDKEIEPGEVKAILASEVAKVLKPVETPFNFGEEKPFVILVVGVNGSGKTTTIGKLGAIAAGEGFSVMLAACDTFRAAAIEQLAIWGQRIGAKVISRPTGADAAGLAFDAMKEARADAADILIIDTAGRLQNKANLMAELDKIVRVIKKQDETAPHAVLLVLDATTGQNAISQADVFTKVAGVTGLIMTKLDGTARGGILVAIAERFKLPIHAIGVGEQIEDLQPFDAEAFSRAIAGLEE